MMKIPGPRYAWIYDILRGSVVCNDPLQIATCVSWLKNHTKIIKAKNRFAEPAFNGYRDLLFHIVIEDKETGFSHVCELQVNMKCLWHNVNLSSYILMFGVCFSFTGPSSGNAGG